MIRTPIDRRAARTRAALEQAFLSLMMSKGYEATTVSDICKAAKVGRSTFYAHFTSKDDLKRSGLQHLRRRLSEIQARARMGGGEAGSEGLSFGSALFEHAQIHRDLYLALAGSAGATVALDTIHQMIVELVHKELPRTGQTGGAAKLKAQFVAGGYMAVLTWWLDSGAAIPSDDMASICRALTLNGVA